MGEEEATITLEHGPGGLAVFLNDILIAEPKKIDGLGGRATFVVERSAVIAALDAGKFPEASR